MVSKNSEIVPMLLKQRSKKGN